MTGKSFCFACACIALAAPADLLASPVSPAPEAASFAYRRSHPVTALPDAAINRVSRSEQIEEPAVEKPYEPPVKIGVAPARALSRESACTAVVSAARANDLPVPFFANLIWQESNFRSSVVSPAGAQGIAQFMPRTAAEMGLLNPFEPIEALFKAGKLLRQLVSQFGNNLGLAAAAYNAGPKRVSDWVGKGSALPGETRDYVRKVTGRHADQWKSRAFAHGPEAELMPARAPCTAVAEEVEAQVMTARAAKPSLVAAASNRKQPSATRASVAVRTATARHEGKRRVLTTARDAVKGIRTGEARADQPIKPVSRVATKVAGHALKKKDTGRVAKADSVGNTAKPAGRAKAAARKIHYAAAR